MFDIRSFLDGIIARINPTPALSAVSSADGNTMLHVHHKDYVVERDNGPKVKAPAHVFTDIDDFAAWLERERETDRWMAAETDILVGERQVLATSDSYDPKDSATIACSLDFHPYWSAWVRSCKVQMTSGAMYEFIREVQGSFAGIPAKVDGVESEVPFYDVLIGQLAKVGITGSSKADLERDEGGMIVSKSKTGKTVINQTIPARWPLRLPVFAAAPDLLVEVEVLASWAQNEKGDDLVFMVRMPLADIAVMNARAQVVAKLRGLLPEFLVGAGKLDVNVRRLD